MDLRRYPFDSQECPIRISSYGYTDDDLVLFWEKNNPVQVSTSTPIPDFTLDGHGPDYCSYFCMPGLPDCVVALFKFKRISFYYLLHNYIPSGLLVAVSWVPFWLIPSSTRTRLTISIGTSFCILFQLYSNSINFLSLYYFTALDIWAAVCVGSVFGALAENLYVNYSHIQRIKAVYNQNGLDWKGNRTKAKHTTFKFLWAKTSGQIPKIDVISRIMFPLFFVLTNVIYWPLIISYIYSQEPFQSPLGVV